jgi:phosphoglycolate phosphatase
MYKNMIFDWSGTLVDDMAPTLEATNAVFELYGKPPFDRETFRKVFHLPYPNFYQKHIPEASLADLESHFRVVFGKSDAATTLLPHGKEMMNWCKHHEIRCFVLTSMDTNSFQHQLDDLEMRHYFESTYSGVLDKRDVIKILLEENQLEARETAYFGANRLYAS